VEEAVLLEADLDERRLHPREHVVDRALVDVPGDRAALRALEVDLGDPVVLDHGDAALADVDRDDELALRLRPRRPARCGAARLPSPAPARASACVETREVASDLLETAARAPTLAGDPARRARSVRWG